MVREKGMVRAPGGQDPLNPHVVVFVLVRGVKKEDKTLAVGIQFMLLRVLGKEPSWDP